MLLFERRGQRGSFERRGAHHELKHLRVDSVRSPLPAVPWVCRVSRVSSRPSRVIPIRFSTPSSVDRPPLAAIQHRTRGGGRDGHKKALFEHCPSLHA